MKRRQIIGSVNLDVIEFAKIQALRRDMPMGAFLTLVLREWGMAHDIEGAEMIKLQEEPYGRRV